MTEIQENQAVRTRIAPSPTGIAHIGTAYIALFNLAFSKKHNGKFIVRIEDTDRQRFVEGAEERLFDALAWLGITADESPTIGGPHAPYRQSEKLETYRSYANQLIEQGHAYYCFCSPETLDAMRKDQQKAGQPPMYDGRCRELDPAEARARAATEPHVIRLHMPDTSSTTWNDLIRGDVSFENVLIDDQVIIKSDGFPTYHLAVVVDDHDMNITHVLRGEEWISSTPKHLVLYEYLGWKPPLFAHMPLLRNADHSKMSKRKNDVSIESYQEKGYLPQTLRNYLCLLGWSHPDQTELFEFDEFAEQFSIERMQKTGPVFDHNKLNWMNGIYIREKLSEDEFYDHCGTFLPADFPAEKKSDILSLIRDRLVVFSEIEELTSFFYRDFSLNSDHFQKVKQKEKIDEYLQLTIEALSSIADTEWSTEKLESALREIQESKNLHKQTLFMSIRIGVSGRSATPPLFEMLEVIGKEIVVKRLETALALFQRI